MGKFMFLLCEYGKFRELLYASCVARKIADKIKMLGHEVILIERPSPQNANDAIAKYKPDVVWWVGHGSENSTTLEYVQLWIQAPNVNTKILDGTIACAESCLTGVYLGKYVTEKEKCRAYLGFREEFWFMWCNDPQYYNCACQGKNPWGVREELWAKMVECMHEACLYFVYGLAQGMTAKDAANYSAQRFAYWITYFTNVEPKDEEEAAVIWATIWTLMIDVSAMVLHGDLNATVPVTPVTFNLAMSIPILMVALGLVTSYVGYKKGKKVV